MAEIYDFDAQALDGTPVDLADYRGKVLLIVNVASKCGFTPQYTGLEKLHTEYQNKGLAILGFPCNQFGAQEPGDAEAIASFCSTTYGVSFPMFEKIDVNGSQAHPLYKWLKSQKPGLAGSQSIKWNFTKFLVDRNGKVVSRFGPQGTPDKIEKHIVELL